MIGRTRYDLNNLWELQKYYREVCIERGWAHEDETNTMLLMLEEVGELNRALREGRKENILPSRDVNVMYELADVALYLIHLANILGIKLNDAIYLKEKVNEARFQARTKKRNGGAQ